MAGDEVFDDDVTSGCLECGVLYDVDEPCEDACTGSADWYVCPDCGLFRPVWGDHDCAPEGDDAA